MYQTSQNNLDLGLCIDFEFWSRPDFSVNLNFGLDLNFGLGLKFGLDLNIGL